MLVTTGGSGQFSPLGRHHLTVSFPRTFKVNKEVLWYRGRAYRTTGKHQNTEEGGKKNSGGGEGKTPPASAPPPPPLRTAGLAETEAPVPGTVRSRHPNVSGTPLPGTSVSQAPHVPDTPASRTPKSRHSRVVCRENRRGARRGSPSDPSPRDDRLEPRARRAAEQTAPRGTPAAASAPAPTGARAPLQGRGRRRLTFLGGVHLVWGAAVTQPRRRPRPGRAFGPEEGKAGGGGQGRRKRTRARQVRALRRETKPDGGRRGRGTATDREPAPRRGRGARPGDGPGRGARRKRRGTGAPGVTSGARTRPARGGWRRWRRVRRR